MTDLTLTPKNLIAAERVTGTDVYNLQGDKLGTVDHVMIDKLSGKVAYAIMSFGGFLGMGEKLFAVPWAALELDTTSRCFVLRVSKARLASAPGFDKQHWPDMADPEWERDVHRFYGTEPQPADPSDN